MKIAFVNIYSGINQRGAESFTHELANRLAKKFDVTFFQAGDKSSDQKVKVIKKTVSTFQPQETIPEGTIKKILKYFFLDRANLSTLKFTLKIIPTISREKFDIVIPLNGFWQLFLLKLLQPIGRYKILVIGHSGPGWDERFNLYLKPNVFIATTKPTEDWAKSICSWTRVKLIPYGIDNYIFNKADSQALSIPKPIILCPSALVPYKRVDLAIRAVAKVKKVSLVVLGKGELKDNLQDLGNRKLGKRFMLKDVQYTQMPNYYKTADLVTLPSSPQENSPMVFLESLAAGKRVVTTDTLRNRWMLEDAAEYCDPEDLESYVSALEIALKNSKDPQNKIQIDEALEKFNIKKVLASYQKMIISLK